MATKGDIVKTLAIIQEVYPNYHPVNAALAVDIWHELLEDIPANELMIAVKALLAQQREFAPSPGQISGEWVKMAGRASGVPSGAEAWAQIARWKPGGHYVSLCDTGQRLYGRAGYWEHVADCGECRDEMTNPPEVHPLAAQVGAALGWPKAFPSQDAGDHIADRAHFIKAYEVARMDAERGAAMPPAVQQFEAARQVGAGEQIRRLAAKMGGAK